MSVAFTRTHTIGRIVNFLSLTTWIFALFNTVIICEFVSCIYLVLCCVLVVTKNATVKQYALVNIESDSDVSSIHVDSVTL